MPELVTDKVLFKMPKSRELQFPAVSVMQNFIETYDVKMKVHDTALGRFQFQLAYDCDISDTDWQFWQNVGLQLAKSRQTFPWDCADMVVDLTEEKLELFKNSGKHVAQIYGVMAGVECKPVPVINQVIPNFDGQWACFQDLMIQGAEIITSWQLSLIKCMPWKGLIGWQGWETYLAKSMGLPLIEVIPTGRPITWLSKWSCPCRSKVCEVPVHRFYHMVMENDQMGVMIERAIAAVERGIAFLKQKEKISKGPITIATLE